MQVAVQSVVQEQVEVGLVDPGGAHADDALVLELGEHLTLVVDFFELVLL